MAHGEKKREQASVEGDWILVGVLGAPHGVRGDMRLKSYTENPAAIFKFTDMRLGADGAAVSLAKKSKNKDGFIVHVEGVDTPEAVSALSGKQLYVRRDALAPAAEDEYYLTDLIGLEARNESGNKIGIVNAVENFGSEDLIEFILDEPIKGLGRYAFIPFRKTFVPDVNLAAGTLTVNMTDWLETQVSSAPEVNESAEEST